MNPHSAELERWAVAYIEAQASSHPVDIDHPLWWAIERTQVPSTPNHAEAVWQLIQQVLVMDPTEHVIGMLGAGPLEDLLEDWGPRFIDRIEAEFQTSAQFRSVIVKCWKSGEPEVWSRVEVLQARHEV